MRLLGARKGNTKKSPDNTGHKEGELDLKQIT